MKPTSLFVPARFEDAFPLAGLLDGVLFPALLASLMLVQIYRYRRVSTSRQRQQTRWVVFGFTVAIGGFIGSLMLTVFTGGLMAPGTWLYFIGNTLIDLFLLAIPISFGIAILRSHLYDIDIIIRRTLVYALLTGSLLVLYFGGVVLLETLLRPLAGQGPNELAIVASTLAIAALFTPLRRRIQA